MENISRAKKILERVVIRPEPEEVAGLDFEEIDEAAQILQYPIYEATDFYNFHRRSLELFEDKIRRLIFDHEKFRPYYIIFGRDGAMIYDAMRMVFQKSEVYDRVKMITVSKPQADYLEGLGQFPKKQAEFTEKMEEYLKQAGLEQKNFKERNWVFLDSGYMGSMFDFILRQMRTTRKEMGANFTGYLICRSEKSPHKELDWIEGPKTEFFFQDFYETFGKSWEEVKSSVVGMNNLGEASLDRKTNWALANYLQIQPKYHRRTLLVEKDGEKWESLPSVEDRVYPLRNQHYLEPKSVEEKHKHPAHSSAVDPVVATKLQIETVRYFGREEVRERVMGQAIYY